MKTSIILFATMILTIIACSNTTEPEYNKFYDSLKNLDAKDAIALANEWKFSEPKIVSYVNPKEVVIEFPDGRVVKKPLPDDLLYIAVAPYVNNTHTCEIHYPSGCQGELAEQSMNLIAKDENGNTYFDGNIPTMKNGFFELWLPRNKDIKLNISYNSQIGEETIPTKDDSRTCITTIRLQ